MIPPCYRMRTDTAQLAFLLPRVHAAHKSLEVNGFFSDASCTWLALIMPMSWLGRLPYYSTWLKTTRTTYSLRLDTLLAGRIVRAYFIGSIQHVGLRQRPTSLRPVLQAIALQPGQQGHSLLSMSYRTDRVRLVVLLKRKPTMTREDFQSHWAGSHCALFISLEIVKKNLLKYEQAHTSNTALQQFSHALRTPIPESEWDGMVIFEAESYAKILEIFQSEEYQRIVEPDAESILDRPNCQILSLGLITVIDK
ncbi:hypothetical protein R3P38DRAFT_788641 [Favolaschia claudopus]|uniref:EthD domain-containing protein n=1 Tax=Favolaschia claudopus TaxID=2862362 RepID=A0AAW0C3K1_9AGAR